MIVELMIVGQALQNFLRKSNGVSPSKVFGRNGSSSCPPCPTTPTKPSAIYDIELFTEVPMFKDLGLKIPTTPSTNGAIIPTPETTGWEILTGQGARDVEYVVNISPEDQAAYREQEKIKQALR